MSTLPDIIKWSEEKWRGITKEEVQGYLESYLTFTRPETGRIPDEKKKKPSMNDTVKLSSEKLEELKKRAVAAGIDLASIGL